ncbi:hypothetical protein KAI46_05205 [bacterium]|nr:hypothetical protein [bacterium]
MENQPQTKEQMLDAQLAAALGQEEQVLKVALIKALGEVQKKPSVENLRGHVAAKKALADFAQEKQMAEAPDEVRFKTVAEAYRYAVDVCGFQRSRQTMDNHIEARLLHRDADGWLSKIEVDKYLALQSGALPEDDQMADLELQDRQAKLKKTKAQAEVWDLRARRERGELIVRNEVDGLLAQRAQFLRQDLENFFRVMAPDIVALVNGDDDRIFDLTEFGLDKLEEYLDRYSRPMPVGEVVQVESQQAGQSVRPSEDGEKVINKKEFLE